MIAAKRQLKGKQKREKIRGNGFMAVPSMLMKKIEVVTSSS